MLFPLVRHWVAPEQQLLLLLLLLLLLFVGPGSASVDPHISNSSETVDGDILSVTSWHARTLTNVSWNTPAPPINSSYVIALVWDEMATEERWWLSDTDNVSRAESPPSSTSSTDDSQPPPIGGDVVDDTCYFREDASRPNSAFSTDENRALVNVDLADEGTWWYTSSLGQGMPNATNLTSTSGVGQASVLLSEPGFYTACLLLATRDADGDETCEKEECLDITVYQPPYDFLEVRSVFFCERPHESAVGTDRRVMHIVVRSKNSFLRKHYSAREGTFQKTAGYLSPNVGLQLALGVN